jgi:2-C-methyl-D-erythritol 4-phosphate cytidylyltransferase/2-C-methyl-D-erythritol 2,4-cyclodiphosphate synthase
VVSLIIAAGGSSRRFLQKRKAKGSQSKLFFSLAGKPVLAHALDAFQGIREIQEILVAVPKGTEKRVQKEILKEGLRKPPVRVVRGGKTRAESVWNALQRSSPRSTWILVHDGARPFPPREAVTRLFRKCAQKDGILLGRPVVSTLKRVTPQNGQVVGTVDRSDLFEAETPQLVRRSLLFKAYRENPNAFLATDEAQLVESVGGRVSVVPHSGWNVKITTLQDLALAQAYLSQKEGVPLRIGFGRDTHRLVSGRPFYLGGVRIPFEKGALGHSDGDALLHAVADALLGSLGLGDIGDWFPPTNARYKNLRSEKFVKKILKEIQAEGWQPERVDTVILLEKPKLGPSKKKIQKEVARILGISPESVSIKAKTQEGLGPEGEGLAVTCEALALLRRAA